MAFHCSLSKTFEQCHASKHQCPRQFHANTHEELKELIETYEAEQFTTQIGYNPEVDGLRFAELVAQSTDPVSLQAQAQTYVKAVRDAFHETCLRVAESCFINTPHYNSQTMIDMGQIAETFATVHHMKADKIVPGQVALGRTHVVAALPGGQTVAVPYRVPIDRPDWVFPPSKVKRLAGGVSPVQSVQRTILETPIVDHTQIRELVAQALTGIGGQRDRIIAQVCSTLNLGTISTFSNTLNTVNRAVLEQLGIHPPVSQPVETAAAQHVYTCGVVEHEDGAIAGFVTAPDGERIIVQGPAVTARGTQARIGYVQALLPILGEIDEEKTRGTLVKRAWKGWPQANTWAKQVKTDGPKQTLERFLIHLTQSVGMPAG